MKLLFDQNISHHLVEILSSLYPRSSHVRLVHLQSASDEVVWNFAKDHGLIIVSKDSDFHQRSFLYGFPPKVIWIRRGNCTTKDVERILKGNVKIIEAFWKDEKRSFLILD